MKKFLIILLVIIIVAVVAVSISLNNMVKNGIERTASKVIGTKVTLDNVDVSPFSGTIKISGFKVANPEGFSEANIFELAQVGVKINSTRKLDGAWIFDIEKIIIDSPKISNEINENGNNIAILKTKMASIETGTDKTPTTKEEVEAKKPSNVFVSISELLITKAEINLSQKILGSNSSNLKLADFKIKQIGDTSDPVNVENAGRLVLEKFFSNIVKTANGKQIKESLQNALGAKLGGALGSAIKSLSSDTNTEQKAAEPVAVGE